MLLKDKVVIVTGASTGIGSFIALRCAAEGAKVALMALCPPEEIAEVKQKILAAGGVAESWIGDVTDAASDQKIVDDVVRKFGSVDVLVNNAGIAYINPVGTAPIADWDRIIAVNLSGPYYIINAVVPHMRKRGKGGSIVNISSICSYWGLQQGQRVYGQQGRHQRPVQGPGKRAVARRIRVNTVAPGNTHTPLSEAAYLVPGMEHSLRKLRSPTYRVFIDPPEIAAAVVFLASDEASAITGVVLPVDDGLSATMPDVLSKDENMEMILPKDRYNIAYDFKR